MTNPALDLPGIPNARELGGYPVGEKYIKKGVLIRTGSLNGAAPEALAILKNRYRLQTVVDFRMNAEQMACPDPQIGNAENIGLSVVETEDFPDADPEHFKQFADPSRDRMALFETVYEAGILGYPIYDLFLLSERGKTAYRSFFRILSETDTDRGAVLWHCTDGKDRTGCAAMLLLSALGASRETVMEDYMLTNVYNAAVLEAVRRKAEALAMPPQKCDALLFMSGCVVAGYMEYAIDALHQRYGSVMGYLRDALGVGAAEVRALREKYLIATKI